MNAVVHGAVRGLGAVLEAASSWPRGFDPDDLGARDPALIRDVLPAIEALNTWYLRLDVAGTERLPAGPALLCANHNGGIAGPDLPCTMGTLWRARGPDAPLWALAHDFAMRQLLPFGRLLQRFGAIRATPQNALAALRRGGQVLVYPGGDLDAYRRFSERGRVVFGARTGFVRIAQAARVPIVPVVAAGAHRSAIILADGARLAAAARLKRWARLERFPVALALPWGLALGPWTPYLPLPLPIRLRFLEPVDPTGEPAAVREHVRGLMQAELERLGGEA